MLNRRDDFGFTLIEVCLAMAVLTIAALGIAPMFGVALRALGLARTETMASALAVQKMEQLRALPWRFDANGVLQPVSDTGTDISRDPPGGGGPGLRPSPSNSLVTNTTNYVDYLDRHGRWIASGSAPPKGAVFIRRWNVTPLPASPADSLVLRVFVTTVAHAGAAGSTGTHAVAPGDASIATVLTRKVN